MWRLLQSLVDRVKVLLAVRAVAELEAEALASSGGRGTALRRLAAGCAAEGLTEVADELRARADQLDHTGGALTPPAPPPALPSAPGSRGRRGG
jgi:hypothetical protein